MTPLLQSNLRKNVLDPILVGRERKKIVRDGMKWKQVRTETIRGVIGGKRGFHAFRRFRATHLAVSGTPEVFQKYWLGHGAKTITESYQKAKQEAAKRREWCEKSGLGFALPGVSEPKIPMDRLREDFPAVRKTLRNSPILSQKQSMMPWPHLRCSVVLAGPKCGTFSARATKAVLHESGRPTGDLPRFASAKPFAFQEIGRGGGDRNCTSPELLKA